MNTAEEFTPHFRAIVATAMKAEHHQRHRTGLHRATLQELMKLIRDYDREPRREAAREAME